MALTIYLLLLSFFILCININILKSRQLIPLNFLSNVLFLTQKIEHTLIVNIAVKEKFNQNAFLVTNIQWGVFLSVNV